MGWRDRLQPGRFRDAAFFVNGADHDIGRRNVVHEYPLRDLPYVEDLGRKAREFGLECFVLGEAYMTARDALIAAVEAEGPGTLVHPWLGQMRVSVVGCRVRESSAEGGLAVFNITFVEAGDLRFPAVTTDTRRLVTQRADVASKAIGQAFAQRFSVDRGPEFLASAGVDLVTQLTAALRALPGPQVSTATADQARALAEAESAAATWVQSPADLAGGTAALVGGVRNVYATPATQLGALGRLYTFGAALPAVPTATATRARQAGNQAAFLALARQAAVIEAARAATTMPFESFNEAATVREGLAEQLDDHMLTADDDTFLALQSLRAAVVRDITARGADLARVVDYIPGATLPALVIAHRLYGDATREAAIVRRNRTIRHPGFVPGGAVIEVLTGAA